MGSCPTPDSMQKKTNKSRQETKGRVLWTRAVVNSQICRILDSTTSTRTTGPCR
ncbi:hypothetical protein HanPSC8_Chr14g0613921 [Helianthus annuus]|nr:hypothetical protein HanPSC8_Chr14g0613921 [Helianthus annuus]